MRSLLLGCVVHGIVYSVWAFVIPCVVSYKRAAATSIFHFILSVT
jgi:hypothetical protein